MAVWVVEVLLPNKTVALVQAADLDEGGHYAEKVGRKDIFDSADVSRTLDAIAQAVLSGLEKVTPSKTTVELGIQLALKNGKLTGPVLQPDFVTCGERGLDAERPPLGDHGL